MGRTPFNPTENVFVVPSFALTSLLVVKYPSAPQALPWKLVGADVGVGINVFAGSGGAEAGCTTGGGVGFTTGECVVYA